MKIPFSLSIILLFPLLIHAYTWQFTSPPSQCSTVTLSIQGSGGQPPYSLLIVPTGPPPLPNNVEVRSIQTIPFSGTSTTLSFNLNYPENSSFVAVVRAFIYPAIFSLISLIIAPHRFAGQRSEWFWYRWRQHSDLRSPIIRFELLQCL